MGVAAAVELHKLHQMLQVGVNKIKKGVNKGRIHYPAAGCFLSQISTQQKGTSRRNPSRNRSKLAFPYLLPGNPKLEGAHQITRCQNTEDHSLHDTVSQKKNSGGSQNGMTGHKRQEMPRLFPYEQKKQGYCQKKQLAQDSRRFHQSACLSHEPFQIGKGRKNHCFQAEYHQEIHHYFQYLHTVSEPLIFHSAFPPHPI